MPIPRLEVTVEELRRAWRRTKSDHPDRTFVSHPYLFDWLEIDLDGWLQSVQARLAAGYIPKSCHICFVPKPSALLRPASILDMEDELVYNLLVGRLMPYIHQQLDEFQGDPDVASQLVDEGDNEIWVKNAFVAWSEMREKSSGKIDEGAQYVVLTDIAGFYENIDLVRLMSDLRSFSNESGVQTLLEVCLKKWSQPRGKGIPQGYTASDILAKVYMNNIDRRLKNDGVDHLRYNDDIRIFCQSKLESRQAIQDLTRLMFQRGLNLQSAKTNIVSASKAKLIFDGVAVVIQGIQEQLADEIREEFDLGNPYLSPLEIDAYLELPDQEAPEVLERAFEEHFNVSVADFNKSLFRFLLRRLGKSGSRIAVDYCLDALRSRPEETESILGYLGKIKKKKQDLDKLGVYVSSTDAIYDFQLYQIIRWFLDNEIQHRVVLRICRRFAFDYNRDPWLRRYSLWYVGRFGDTSDLELVEARYGSLTSELDRADCAVALKRLERARRNSFYGRIEGDGDLVRRSIEVVKRSR